MAEKNLPLPAQVSLLAEALQCNDSEAKMIYECTNCNEHILECKCDDINFTRETLNSLTDSRMWIRSCVGIVGIKKTKEIIKLYLETQEQLKEIYTIPPS